MLNDGDEENVHFPLILIEDTSASTERLKEKLNQNMRGLIRRLQQGKMYNRQMELFAIHFNTTHELKSYFKPICDIRQDELNIESGSGFTDTGRAIHFALDELEQKQKMWDARSERHVPALMILMTDGYPDLGPDAGEEERKACLTRYERAADRVRELEETGRLVLIGVGIEHIRRTRASMKHLRYLNPHEERLVVISEGFKTLEGFDKLIELVHVTAEAMISGAQEQRRKQRPEQSDEMILQVIRRFWSPS